MSDIATKVVSRLKQKHRVFQQAFRDLANEAVSDTRLSATASLTEDLSSFPDTPYTVIQDSTTVVLLFAQIMQAKTEAEIDDILASFKSLSMKYINDDKILGYIFDQMAL